MILKEITDSEMIRLLIEEGVVESQTKLGLILGMTKAYGRSYLSNVRGGSKPLAVKYRLMIVQLYPDFAARHKLNKIKSKEDEITTVNEPKTLYSNQIKKEMKNLADDMMFIKHDVHQLKKQVAKLTEQNTELIKELGQSQKSE